jgi:FlaA1/EpsC-like NDP-sugar epimerase
MNKRVLTKIIIDGGSWYLLTFFAFYLRLEAGFFAEFGNIFMVATALLPLKLFLIYAIKLHLTSWRYSIVSDFKPILFVVGAYTGIFFVAAYFLRGTMVMPLTVPIIEAVLAIVMFVAIRLASRFALRERKIIQHYNNRDNTSKRILILGAGESGTMIAKEMERHPEMGMVPVAFLDDARVKQNQRIQGLPVLGPVSDMTKAVREHAIDEVLIAMPSEAGDVIRVVVEQARKAKVRYKTVPGLYDLISGKVGISQIREVQVEDLLRRNPIKLHTAKIQQYLKENECW